MEIAKAQGRAVGLVTNARLTDPAPSAFYAHTPDAGDIEGLATQLAEHAKIDVVLGGGSADFLPAPTGRRTDGRDLLADLERRGAEMAWTKADLENAATYREKQIIGVFSPGPLAFSDEIESGSQQPSLSDMVRRAIQFLQVNGQG
jgi:alkaline phosphatase